jgi:hypothetical protein
MSDRTVIRRRRRERRGEDVTTLRPLIHPGHNQGKRSQFAPCREAKVWGGGRGKEVARGGISPLARGLLGSTKKLQEREIASDPTTFPDLVMRGGSLRMSADDDETATASGGSHPLGTDQGMENARDVTRTTAGKEKSVFLGCCRRFEIRLVLVLVDGRETRTCFSWFVSSSTTK